MIHPPKETYGVDHTHKLVVWNYKIPKDSISKFSEKSVTIGFQDSLSFQIPKKDISYTRSYQLKKDTITYNLYFTDLPLIQIYTNDSIKDEPKIRSNFSYADQDTIQNAIAGIELRGNISLGFPKKSYDLEFWDDPVKKTSTDIQFSTLRNDDDWILDGLYNEPLRLRSFLANTTWLSIHKPHYQNKEKNASSGIDMIFSEVFLNGRYIGIHALTEQVDRKLLQLKKYESGKVRGELFKANSHEDATKFENAPDFNNLFPHWGGFRMEYPVVENKSYWNNIHDLVTFISTSQTTDFNKHISERFDIHNAIDYFLFINLFRATDNLSKNYYVARYDEKNPYFMVPWDLDGVLGTIQDGKRIPTTDDMLSNGLFDRLLRDNPDDFRNKLQRRWLQLRNTSLSDNNLFGRLQNSYQYFDNHKIYEREQRVWPSIRPNAEHLDYVTDWLTQRLQFLDEYFSKL